MSPRVGSLTTEKSSSGFVGCTLDTLANSSPIRLMRVRSLSDATQATRELSSTITVSSARAVCAIKNRSEEHTSELQSLMRNSYAVFCLTKKRDTTYETNDMLPTRIKKKE